MPEIKLRNKGFMNHQKNHPPRYFLYPYISLLSLLLSMIFLTTNAVAEKEFTATDLRNGDLLFQSLHCGPLCEELEAALQTPYSHLGIVYFDPQGIRIIESTDRVKLTPLKEWLAQTRNNSVEIFRLRKSSQKLGYGEAIVNSALQELGKPYDDDWEWDNQKLYCSELVWKTFFAALKIKLSTPKDYFDELNNAANKLFWQGYFRGTIPHRLGVSPKDLAASRFLEKLGSLKSR